VQKEPFLVTALRNLAYAANLAAEEANNRWDFAAMEGAVDEAQDLYRQLLKLDPRNITYQNNLATSNTQPLLRHLCERDLAGYNRYAGAFISGLMFEGAANFHKNNEAVGRLRSAATSAAFGREVEVPALLARVQTLVKELLAAQTGDSVERVLAEEFWNRESRRMPLARLDWPAVRRESEATLARLDREATQAKNQDAKRNLEWTASYDLMFAAWLQGDTAVARRALDRWWAVRESTPENSPPQDRLDEATDRLERAEVLLSAGETTEARAILAAVEREAVALLALKPDAKSTQMLIARTLWLKARAKDGLAAAEKGAMLDRALEITNRFFAEGRLGRWEIEIVHAGIRADLQRL
jgi:hypothetical protein